MFVHFNTSITVLMEIFVCKRKTNEKGAKEEKGDEKKNVERE